MVQSQFVQFISIGEDEELDLDLEEWNEEIYGDGNDMEDEDYIPAEDEEDEVIIGWVVVCIVNITLFALQHLEKCLML